MKRSHYYLSLFCAALMFAACSSDDGNPNEEPGPVDPAVPCATAPSAEVFKELRGKAFEKMIQRKTYMDALSGIDFKSKKGVEFVIFPGGLGSEEEENVSGEVDLEYLELFDRASMVLADKPMMGKNEAGVFSPVATAGQFYINITKEGKNLTPVFFNLIVPTASCSNLVADVVLWSGKQNEQKNLEWRKFIPGPTEISAGVQLWCPENVFVVAFMDFGWIALNRVDETPRARAPIQVRVPECYNNENSAVYVAFKGKSNVLGALDLFDADTMSFTEDYGWGPVGSGAYIIMLSEREGSLVYAIKEVVLGNNTNVAIVAEDLKKATETELATAIRALK